MFSVTSAARFVICWVLLGSQLVADTESAMARSRRAQVQDLIRKLDAERYIVRQQAAFDLLQLGHDAIDLLIEAQYDQSSEISLASQQLLAKLHVVWTREDEPLISQQIMADYDRQPLDRRADRAEWLAQLEDGAGLVALTRIVRYEPSELIAKQAALHLIQNLDHQEKRQVDTFRNAVDQILLSAKRQPCKWLTTFAQDLAQPNQTSETWLRMVSEEQQLAEGNRTTDSILTNLSLYAAARAINANNAEAFENTLRKLVELNRDNADVLGDIGRWLIDHDKQAEFIEWVWDEVDQHKVDRPKFHYLAAEASLPLDEQQAKDMANTAFELTQNNAQFSEPLTTAFVRINAGIALENRGLTEWALREYRRIIEYAQGPWRMELVKEQATILASELLHDRGRDNEAADILAKLGNVQKPQLFGDTQVTEGGEALLARRYYFRSEHFRQQSNREKQIEFLLKAIEADHTDADVLIAMYRLPRQTAEWKADVQRKIKRAAAVFEQRLKRLRSSGEIENRAEVAKNLNQLSWLIGNTEGDQEQAVQQSRRSLELRPHSAGSLDTLGRCYFAVGDQENAIKYQRRAHRLEPHSQQIRRQLEEFELAASQGAIQ